jgi:molybdate transport system substrate-binding protein
MTEGERCARLGRLLRAAGVALAVGLLLGCSSPPGGRSGLLVFAAASLNDALIEIGRSHEAETGVEIAFSFGGSQALAQQIASGAPADLFVAAGEFPIEFLAEKDLVESDPVHLLSNRLVVVVRSGSLEISSMDQLGTDAFERVAVADPDLAPAGRYARQALTNLGIWDNIKSKLIIGSDVRATLVYVETGNADAALVYATDASMAGNVTVLDIVPTDSYPSVVYPAALVRDSTEKEKARAFLEYLTDESATALFIKHGFQPLGP